MRDNLWLIAKLDQIWKKYFSDIERKNQIYIKFGQRACRRLGSIRQINPKDKNSATKILITGYFMDERVPEEMIGATIAHEIVHYAHGFCSPLPKLSRYPHQGGIVDNELRRRGLCEILDFQKKWLKSDWPKIIGTSPTRQRRRATRRKTLIRLLGF